MKAFDLREFGIDKLRQVSIDDPVPGSGQVLVKLSAASINYRDFMICAGQFAPPDDLPIVPLSDGAGEIVAVGDDVTNLVVGDRVSPLFFPRWMSGDALGDERAISTGLEADGCLREYGVFDEQGVVTFASHLTDEQAACFPCAGLTAWSALVTTSNMQPGNTVLVLGTGGVSIFALQFAKALGGQVIVTSSSSETLERAQALGADHLINYSETPDWGLAAKDLTGGRGVDIVVEVGGTNTLGESFRAVRRGGHIPVIGALTGAKMDILVYDLIMTNAHVHGISVGNRSDCEDMMRFVEKHRITPVIDRNYAFDDAANAIRDIDEGEHFGKLTITI
jgi:NADPH:quinone reductase-like Zn-dependent oxidoreductase